jgi:hypothetical protein
VTQRHRFILPLTGAMAAIGVLAAPSAAAASSLQVIYQIASGGDHLIGTFANADGSVFVVSDVGQNGRGQILLLTPDHKKYKSAVIKEFACDTDGSQPAASLTADVAGNVWGMTNTGCGTGTADGTLFELVKPTTGKKWTFRTVLQMPSSIGYEGVAGSGYGQMVFDDVGNLYGLEALGCNDGSCGKIYEVPATLLGTGKPKGKVKILYSFAESNEGQPFGLVRDKNGNLFGNKYAGGAHNLGSAWEVSPPKRPNGAWTGRNIYDFCSDPSFDNCDDGEGANGLPTLDANGVLYGTTFGGGPNFGSGTVWSLTPSPNGKTWAFRQLHTFNNPSVCAATTDYGIYRPYEATAFNQDGQLLTYTQQGGFFDPCGTSQRAIAGALISIDPASGADAIASNQFAAADHVSGPYLPVSSPSVLGNTVFGTSSEYYDAGSDTYSAGVVFKITP